MLSAVYLSDNSKICEEYSGLIENHNVDFSVTLGGDDINYDLENGAIVTTAADQSITLEFEPAANSVTYVQMEGLKYEATSEYELYWGNESVDPKNLYSLESLSLKGKLSILKNNLSWVKPDSVNLGFKTSNGLTYSLTYLTEAASFTCNMHDYIINTGYSKDGISSITITFPKRGVYNISSLEIISTPVEQYVEKISLLSQDTLEDIQYGVNSLSGKLSLDEPKILCIAIPYSDGWSAYVDGEKAEIYVANGHYIGIDIPEGEHSVSIIYSRPYKHLGEAVSIIGFTVFVALIAIHQKRKRSK